MRTSEGTLHALVQLGSNTSTCGSGGLWWLHSIDGGNNWTCGGQLSSDTSDLVYGSARADTNDNIYTVYSMLTNGASTSKNVYYRKLTKSEGSSWTLGGEQTVLSGSATTGYHYADIELQGTVRLWLATRYYDGTNYQVSVYYSDDLSSAPSWSLSEGSLSTPGTGSTYNHYPHVVRYGSNVGVVYTDIQGRIMWRHREDTDLLSYWTTEEVIREFLNHGPRFSVAGDVTGNVYLAVCTGSGILFRYYNGWAWSGETAVHSGYTPLNNSFVSLSTDGINVWVFWASVTGFSSGLSGNRVLYYRKGVPPYDYDSFDSEATPVVEYHGPFDQYWSYVSSVFLDGTDEAGNNTTGDTQMVTSIGDMMYFGREEKFDSISWDVSTNGSGGQVEWEYWDGSIWSSLTFSVSTNTNFQGDGWGSFADPPDWEQIQINGEAVSHYYIRARVTTAYSTSPIGTQFVSTPRINLVSATISPSTDTVYAVWTENASSPTRVRVRGVPVTAFDEIPNTSEIQDIMSVVTYSTGQSYNYGTGATQPSTMRHLLRTSDGTLHAFVQSGRSMACTFGTGDDNYGLNWIYSVDSGETWTCGGQLATFSYLADLFRGSNLYAASAVLDANDNMYVVYSTYKSTYSAAHDVFFRKFTKGAGSSWIMEDAQLVLDSPSSEGYSFATIALEDSTRIWLATKYFDGTDYRISVYYSDGLDSMPSWTLSSFTLDSKGPTDTVHIPSIVRFDHRIAVIYSAEAGNLQWRYRLDSDSLGTWTSPIVVIPGVASSKFSTSGTESGKIFLCAQDEENSNVYFSYFNGSSWIDETIISDSGRTDTFSSISTDGINVWVFFGDSSGLSEDISGNRRLVYKRGIPPYSESDFSEDVVSIISHHGFFDKCWSVVSGSYLDCTEEAQSSSSENTRMLSALGDSVYFGRSTKFDSVDWVLETEGSGGRISWEYWNGSSWVRITKFFGVYNTAFTGDGYLSFSPLVDWTKTKINNERTSYYYIRARVIDSYTISPTGIQFSSIPQINWPSFLEEIGSDNTLRGIWTENKGYYGAEPARVRFTSFSNYPPNPPSSIGPSDLIHGQRVSDVTPMFTFFLTDQDSSDRIRFRIQVDDSPDFSSPVVDYISDLDNQGLTSYILGASGGYYIHGSEGFVLSEEIGYYWRVKAIDEHNDEGSWIMVNDGDIAFILDRQFSLNIIKVDNYPVTPIRWLVNRYPVFEGSADPFASIRIDIISAMISDWVTASDSGYWTWKPDTSLPLGIHVVTVTGWDEAGNFASDDMTLVVLLSFGSTMDVEEDNIEEEVEEDTDVRDNLDYDSNTSSGTEEKNDIEEEGEKGLLGGIFESLFGSLLGEKGIIGSITESIREINNSQGGKISAITLLFVAALTGGAEVAAVAGMSIVHVPLLFSNSFLGGLLGFARKRKPWGVVYDSVTKEPLSRAVVRVYKGKALAQTTVTDINGVFAVDLGPGSYSLQTQKGSYVFPTEIVAGDTDGNRTPLYKGGLVTSPEEGTTLSTYVPVDPVGAMTGGRILTQARSLGSTIFGRAMLAFLFLGAVFSFWSFLVVGGVWYLLLTILNMLMLAFNLSVRAGTPGGWGEVVTEEGEPVSGLEVGLYDLTYDRLIDDRVTDDEGRYRFIAPGGRYWIRPMGGDFVLSEYSGKGGVEVGEETDRELVLSGRLTVRRASKS